MRATTCTYLRTPTGLADGFGVGSRLCAYAQCTPSAGSPAPGGRRDSAALFYHMGNGAPAALCLVHGDASGHAGGFQFAERLAVESKIGEYLNIMFAQ
ncbi:MAG: hypothetical protein Kow0010_10330 [Dehalococcoidia bacterium]